MWLVEHGFEDYCQNFEGRSYISLANSKARARKGANRDAQTNFVVD